MRPSRRLATVLAASVALCASSTAAAQFTRSAAVGPTSVGSATLAPPTATSAAQVYCRANRPVTIGVAWTASASVFATGYRLERATSTAGPFVFVATLPSGTTSHLDAYAALAYGSTYVYRVHATYRSWAAVSATATVVTLSIKCL